MIHTPVMINLKTILIAWLLVPLAIFAQDKDTLAVTDTSLVQMDSLAMDSLALDSAVVVLDSSKIIVFDTIVYRDKPYTGTLSMEMDSGVYKLLDNHRMMNIEKCPYLVNGFRVQIFSSSGRHSRNRAENYRQRFMTAFPEIGAYSKYQEPNYKVRVGDCRTRLEAEKIKAEIKRFFPDCYIVPDIIQTEFTQDCE